jgi:hypothetical protein
VTNFSNDIHDMDAEGRLLSSTRRERNDGGGSKPRICEVVSNQVAEGELVPGVGLLPACVLYGESSGRTWRLGGLISTRVGG